MNNYDYPIGADTKEAPWNQEDSEDVEAEVLVSITLSKTVKVTINKEDAKDPIECNLKKVVEEQITLHNKAGDIFKNVNKRDSTKYPIIKSIIEDLSNWNVDDYEVILEKI